eukprot:g363.t1
MDITDKFLKFDGGASKGGRKKGGPRRHLSSADGHARRTRMARARKANPKLVDQLVKDIKYELSVGSSASGVAPKSWRAAQEANTLRERIQQIETQFKLRLQITLQRGEERQKELSQLIERQKSDLHNLQMQRDFQTSCHVKEMAGLKSENNKLRSEIAEKQKALERSIAHRHKVEESLVEMSRWFRTKGKFSDNIPIDELLNRFATARGSNPDRSRARGRSKRRESRSLTEGGAAGDGAVDRSSGGYSVSVVTSNSISSQSAFGGSSIINVPYHDLEAELQRANAQAAQASQDYQHVLQVNESLQDELMNARAAASESSAATQRVQTESRNAIMDIASRASKQLKHQQERCNSLEEIVEKLQSQLSENKKSHLDTMKILEADLLLTRQTVRKKELERDMKATFSS